MPASQPPPSILNDVIGPVMRGPSSSHCAAALRIGRIARDLMTGDIDSVDVRFDPHGSLATTHQTQGSDMGLCGGLLGLEVTDKNLVDAEQLLRKAGIKINYRITPIAAKHPNTYLITLKHKNRELTLTAVSTGGGIIELTRIDEFALSLRGDYYETLVYVPEGAEKVAKWLGTRVDADYINVIKGNKRSMLQIKAQAFLAESVLDQLRKTFAVAEKNQVAPVLPVLSHKDLLVPFSTCEKMQDYNKEKNRPLWQLAIDYEMMRGNLREAEVMDKMREIVAILRNSIKEGIKGTEYNDRILKHQSGKFKEMMAGGQLLDAGMLNRMTLYVTALMEVKSAMGLIVAAPTAGSCGGLPGAVIAAAEELRLSAEDMTRALLAAGMIGVFIAEGATFAAEVGGCQAETGAGAGMAAAGLVNLAGGTIEQAIAAASMALQNTFGMTCDPVANRVEVPCLGKNVMAAANALTCANMALAGFDQVIPLDEVIEAMDAVGKSLPHELRCTALGGLSLTRTAKKIEQKLMKPDQT